MRIVLCKTALVAAIVLPVAAFAGPAAAAPRTIDDCEKITAADAYNKCLASFGPVAHEHRLQPVGPQQQGPGPYRARTYQPHPHQAWPRVVSRGRQRMEFVISPRHERR